MKHMKIFIHQITGDCPILRRTCQVTRCENRKHAKKCIPKSDIQKQMSFNSFKFSVLI